MEYSLLAVQVVRAVLYSRAQGKYTYEYIESISNVLNSRHNTTFSYFRQITFHIEHIILEARCASCGKYNCINRLYRVSSKRWSNFGTAFYGAQE